MASDHPSRRLTLKFRRQKNVELTQVEYEHSSSRKKRSFRGKGLGIDPDAGSFQWTSAVKAFALLVVGSRYALSLDTPLTYLLSGEDKSAASSLDYAISKPTQWILDMFGVDGQERAIALRVFVRRNTERKLPGPVDIELSQQLRNEESLQVFLDGELLSSTAELEELFAELRNYFPGNEEGLFKEGGVTESAEPLEWHQRESFRAAVTEDVQAALADTELLEEQSIVEAKKRLQSTDWFRTDTNYFEDLTKRLPAQHERYDFDIDALKERKEEFQPMAIACTSMALPAIAVLRYLERVLEYPIEVRFSYPGTSAIINDLEGSNAVQAMLLSWGAASRLENTNYKIQMLCPRTSFDLVLPESVAFEKLETLALAQEKSAYPWLYYSALLEAEPKLEDINLQNASIADITHLIRQKGAAAIIGFPYSFIACEYFGYDFYKRRNSYSRLGDNILFAREENEAQAKNNEILRFAIRAAWFSLLENPDLLAQLVDTILFDEEYILYLKRIGSLYKI